MKDDKREVSFEGYSFGGIIRVKIWAIEFIVGSL